MFHVLVTLAALLGLSCCGCCLWLFVLCKRRKQKKDEKEPKTEVGSGSEEPLVLGAGDEEASVFIDTGSSEMDNHA